MLYRVSYQWITSPRLPMKPRKIQEYIRACRRDDEDLGPKTQYMAFTNNRCTTYCMNEVLYAAFKTTLDPLIGDCEPVWVESKGEKFLLFECADRAQNWALRERFWSIGSQVRRSARVRKAAGHHLKEHHRVLWDIQCGRCYFSGVALGEKFEDRKFSVDHLYPLASRPWPYLAPKGTHWPINLALVTPFVNQGKGGRTPAEYLAEVKKYKTFTPTAAKERRRVNNLRYKLFGDYMRQHCSDDEDDWGPSL